VIERRDGTRSNKREGMGTTHTVAGKIPAND
jgi:hypothetical protein